MMQLKKFLLLICFCFTNIAYAYDISGSIQNGIYHSADHLLSIKVPNDTVGITDKGDVVALYEYPVQEVEFQVVPAAARKYFEKIEGSYVQDYVVKYSRTSISTGDLSGSADRYWQKVLQNFPYTSLRAPKTISKKSLTINGHEAMQWIFIDNSYYGEISQGWFEKNKIIYVPTLYVFTLINFDTYMVNVEYRLTTHDPHPNIANILKNYNQIIRTIKIAGE